MKNLLLLAMFATSSLVSVAAARSYQPMHIQWNVGHVEQFAIQVPGHVLGNSSIFKSIGFIGGSCGMQVYSSGMKGFIF
jgi:hypothetical protein